MIQTSAAYAATQARLQRTPIYKAKFDSWPIPYSTHPIRIFTDVIEDWRDVDELFTIDETKVYESADDFPHIDQSVIGDLFLFESGGGVATTKPYASLFEGQQSQVFPEQGHSSIGSVTFVLTDVGEDVTNLVMSGILGERVQLFAGFDDIDEEDYLLFFTGVVASIRSDDLAGYEITVYSTQSLLNRQVFNVSVSALAVALTAEDVFSLQYDIAAGIISGFGVYVKVDDEIIWVGTIDTTSGIAAIIQRGALGTTAAAHAIGAEVRELIRLGPAHPMEILLGLYQNTDKTGVGLDPSYIDMAGIAAAIPLIGAAYQMEFRITQPENAMQWAERELFQPLGAYPVTKSDGRNSIVVFRAPAAEDSVATIDHDSIVHDGERPMMTWELGRDGSLGQIINDVTWLFDHNPVTDTFAASAQFERTPSIQRFGRYPVVIESRGLRSDLPNTLTLLAARALALLNRYENGAPVVRLTTFLGKELIEPGEIIGLTSALLPNRFTKTRGVTEALVEVVNRNIRFASGQVDFDLLWTSFSDLARDDFNRADVNWSDDADLNSDGAWLAMAQDTRGIHIVDGELYLGRLGTKLAGAGAGASGHGAMVRTQVIGANQSSQLTFRGVLDSGGFAGPAVRASFVYGSGGGFEWLVTMSGYAAMYDSINEEITLRLYNGTDPQVSTGLQLADAYPVTLVAGDNLRIDARGSNIRVYLNDVLIIGPIINTVQTTNFPGALSNYTGTAGGIVYDGWSGGDTGFA